jgi:peroxiredoxin
MNSITRLITIVLFFSLHITVFSQSDNVVSRYLVKKDSILRIKIGTIYPCFKVHSLSGDTISDYSLNNKITVINFWQQYCSPCIHEFDSLNNIFHDFKFHKDFQFLSFTCDSISDARSIVEKFSLLYPVCSISKAECYRLNLQQGFPTTIIVDRKRRISYIKSGMPSSQEKMKEAFKKYRTIISDLLYE